MSFDLLLPLLEKKRNSVLSNNNWRKIDIRKPIVVLPLPYNGEDIIRTLRENSILIEKIFDNNPELHGKKIDSVEISPVDYIKEFEPSTQIVIITKNPKVVDQLIKQLLKLGIEKHSIYTFYDLLNSISENLRLKIHRFYMVYFDISNEYNDKYAIESKSENLIQLMDCLADERSKNVLLSLLAARYYEDFRLLSFAIDEKPQYFTNFFPIRENEIFIDAGAYIGDTVSDFIMCTKNNNYSAYCYEPNPIIYKRLQETICDNKKINIVNAGLGLKNGILKFRSAKDGSGKIDKGGDLEVKIYQGDSLNIIPTWIKADVEGNEIAMLNGFNKTIRKYKPRLSICVYHNHDDLWEIPKYIKSLNPDYHLFFRHYALNSYESVIYAAMPGDYSILK